MKKLLFAVATMGLLFASCSKDDDSNGGNEPKNAPLAEYILGIWNFNDVSVSGNIQSPFFSGTINGTSEDVSGNWEFKSNGTVTAQMKYKMTISVQGMVIDEEEVDETLNGTYTVTSETSISLTDATTNEVTTFNIANRNNTSFDLTSTEEINEMGATGTINTVVKLGK
ncbi:MAG: hypothetical protein LAT76_00605 [Schleiferiaceae bacterium]|nr:hypothetical protein [Schleiferiaceae bacterium]